MSRKEARRPGPVQAAVAGKITSRAQQLHPTIRPHGDTHDAGRWFPTWRDSLLVVQPNTVLR
jgi:hypothetical protein